MAEQRPMISVIMPAYNAAQYIEAAIRSVMAQTVTDWELLVLDDCSTDHTCAVVEKLATEDSRIRLIRNEQNKGVARVRNQGFELCRGEYVALLDSDDAWLPEKLERQLARLKSTGADLCYCSYEVMDGKGEKARADYLVPEETDFEKLLRENVIGCSTVLLRREVIEKYRFNTDFYHEDYILWLQLLKDGYQAAGCGEILARWRLIETSRSFHKGNAAKNRWKIYREYLKLPLLKSLWVFGAYACSGLKKYGKRDRG